MPNDRDDDNLVQLPVGARFGMDHEPTPREREDLVRFAAAADAELHGEQGHREVASTGEDTDEDAGTPQT